MVDIVFCYLSVYPATLHFCYCRSAVSFAKVMARRAAVYGAAEADQTVTDRFAQSKRPVTNPQSCCALLEST